jgi:hypothetical protein
MQIFPSIIADHGAQVSIGNTYVSNHTRVRSSRHGPSVGEMDLGLRAAEQTARQAEVLGRQFDADMQQLGSHMEELFGSVGAGDSRNGNPSRASSDMRSRPSSPQSDKSGSCFSLFRCGRPRTKSRNRPSRTPTPSDASGRYGYQLSTHVFGNQGIEQDGESPHIRLDPLVTPLPVHLRDTPHHTVSPSSVRLGHDETSIVVIADDQSGRNGCSSASEAEHHDPSDPPPPYTDDRSNTETPSRRRG